MSEELTLSPEKSIEKNKFVANELLLDEKNIICLES
jgi:hypothetical protein